ncbi:MAG: hypothetical protein HOP30_20740, partial [Cyclobacteriaceae bacterium]|nr:hypothetical protein [Cyclobacteriaceae bacterium]
MLEHLERNNRIIREFIDRYSKKKRPIEVSFRDLIPELSKIDRHTHLIHPYPAKLLAHIPNLFINNSILSKEQDYVLDPFCGTGTVLLESALYKRRALGADANPLAQMIAKAKTCKLNGERLQKELCSLLKKSRNYKLIKIPDFSNRDYWFAEQTQIQLAKIYSAIVKIKNENVRTFFLVNFSNCIRKVSYADPRVSVPVRINKNRFKLNDDRHKKIKIRLAQLNKMDVFEKFESICTDNIERIKKLKIETGSVEIISNDARKLTTKIGGKKRLKRNCIQLIITSPPYAGAQKYIRASSLSLGWLGIAKNGQLKKLDNESIGRESFLAKEKTLTKTGIPEADNLIKKIYEINETRATIVSTYLNEMKVALSESYR